jgi:hypothetical protein
MAMDGRIVVLLWLAQLIGCLYLGYRTSRKTGRSMLNWIFMGLLLAVIFPPVGFVVSLVAFLYYPPLTPAHPMAEREDRRAGPGTGRRRPGAGV